MKRKESTEVEAMLEELKRAASELGIEVREEEILREVGYRARSGVCRVGDRTVVVVDRRLPGTERVEILCNALASQDLERIFLAPALRAKLTAAKPRAAEADPGQSSSAEPAASAAQSSPAAQGSGEASGASATESGG